MAFLLKQRNLSFWNDCASLGKILNLNVSYADEGGPVADAQIALRELEAQGLNYEIELFAGSSGEGKSSDNSSGTGEAE